MDIRTGTCKLNLILVLLVVFPTINNRKFVNLYSSIVTFTNRPLLLIAQFKNPWSDKRILFSIKTQQWEKRRIRALSRWKSITWFRFNIKDSLFAQSARMRKGEGGSFASAQKQNETIQFPKLWLQLRLLRFFLAENQIKSGDKDICHHQVIMLH